MNVKLVEVILDLSTGLIKADLNYMSVPRGGDSLSEWAPILKVCTILHTRQQELIEYDWF